jgi:hypothetical protein
VAISASIREPRRLVPFALAVLVHVGLWHLLVSQRQPSVATAEPGAQLVFLRDPVKPTSPPLEVAPPRLQQGSPPQSLAPRLIAAPTSDDAPLPPSIDWRREAEQAARDNAIAAQAQRPKEGEQGGPKPQPEFHWSHSSVHRIEPMENGGFVVWLNDKCGIAITLMAMPFCQLGKKPARGDLFEHMDDAPTPGDWKDP